MGEDTKHEEKTKPIAGKCTFSIISNTISGIILMVYVAKKDKRGMRMKKKLQKIAMLATVVMSLGFGHTMVAHAATGDVVVNETNFPDPVFREYINTNIDLYSPLGILTSEERFKVEEIEIIYTDLETLKGIEFFPNLTKLECFYNKMTELDVSQNKKLTYLDCTRNKIPELNLENNTELVYLRCEENELTEIDVSKNILLDSLNICVNKIDSIDISANVNLTYFQCGITDVSALDVSANTKLKSLGCAYTNIKSLDISKLKELKYLGCSNTQISALDLSNNTQLMDFYCENTDIKELVLNNNSHLNVLNCGNTPMKELDLSNKSELTILYCWEGQLESINLEGCESLQIVNLNKNMLQELSLSDSPNLYSLNCRDNRLIHLDVSKNEKLQVLSCDNNQLIDIQMPDGVSSISLDNNKLSQLDISNIRYIEVLNCSDNMLSSVNFAERHQVSHTSFSCKRNVAAVSAKKNLDGQYVFDLSTLPGNFDVTRVSNVNGGTIQGNQLFFDEKSTIVTYDYDCGKGVTRSFSLAVQVCQDTHSWDGGSVLENASCKNEGLKVIYCAICGELKKETLPKLDNHFYDSGRITTAPTYEKEGVKTYTCTTCGVTKTEAITKLTKPAEKPSQPDCNSDNKRDLIESFVSRMFNKALGRNYDANGLKYWSDRLESHVDDGANVAYGFFNSDEFLKKSMDNATYINTLYATFFGRVSDIDGFNYWNAELNRGVSRNVVLCGFISSNEFNKLCEDAGINRGFSLDNGTVANAGIYNFVERMYTKCLGREGEKTGLEYWTLEIATKQQTAVDAAKNFFGSNEFVNKKYGEEEYIKTLYRTFMDREADANGLSYWENEMAKGMTREQVLDGFASSNEFKQIMSGFGL